MSLRVTVLGCSGSYPAVDCACSGYLVQHQATSVLIDLGPGCLSVLQKHLHLADVSAIVLSHSHADHWSDLAGLHVASKYRYGRTDIPVWGTAETRRHAHTLLGEIEPTFAWTETGDGDVFAIDGLQFTLERTDHYVETHAMRVDARGGGSLVYSADTGPEWSIESLGRNVDLAIVEATYGTDAERGDTKHLSARAAGEMSRAAGAKQCLLTHFWPESDLAVQARNGAAAYGAPVLIASPDTRYIL